MISRICGLLAVAIIVILLVVSFLDMPTVYVDGVSRAPVGCVTAETVKPIAISDPRCQVVLRQHHDVEVSAPGWHP